MVNTVNFKTLSELWRKEKQSSVKMSTMSAYNLILDKYLLKEFQYENELTEQQVQSFFDRKYQDGLSEKSLRDILVVLRMIIRFGKSRGYIQSADFKINIPKEYKIKEVPVFSIFHQKKLMTYLIENISFKNLGILISMNTGMRIGEICALKWSDIDLTMNRIMVSKTIGRIYKGEESQHKTEVVISLPKTKTSYRNIPISDCLHKIFLALDKDINRDGFVLTNNEKPIEPRVYRNYYNHLLKKLEMPHLKFHSLRHSFATRCIECNCDYKSVSEILGHADISTTLNLYVHPSPQQKKECIEKMLGSMILNTDIP